MYVKTGSHAPNLEIEKQTKLIESAQTLLALQSAGVEREQALRLIEEAYSLDLDEQAVEEISEVGEETLELMFTALDQSTQLGLPVSAEELYALAPVRPTTLGHKQTLRFWREWLSSRDGRRAPQEIIKAVELHIYAEIDAIQQEAMIMGQLAMAGSPEMMMAQAMPDQSNQPPQGKEKGKPPSAKSAGAAV